MLQRWQLGGQPLQQPRDSEQWATASRLPAQRWGGLAPTPAVSTAELYPPPPPAAPEPAQPAQFCDLIDKIVFMRHQEYLLTAT